MQNQSLALNTSTFEIGPETFLLNGKPFVIRCGEIHFSRMPRAYWSHRLRMCHAMGLNTVCVYLMWNFHEWTEGQYNWSRDADVAEFCRLAQREGLWVLLRPGPYSCAEWEMGGLPWWLLKNKTIHLRSRDPLFLKPAREFLKEVGRVLAPLQIDRGGPILMVQVENEYGSYGNDSGYIGELRQALIDADFTVPLFACNPPGAIANGYRSDLFQVVNFGPGNAEQAFATLRTFQKTGPLMNGEFYPGWFDTWGVPHQDKPIDQALEDLKYMLEHGHSFSIYMAHGGTTFGLWSGADRPFKPDTSSYDYNAPISEAGWPTPKFHRIRDLLKNYLDPDEVLPEIPESIPIGSIATFSCTERAGVFDNLPTAHTEGDLPKSIETYDQGSGCVLYRCTIPAGPKSLLSARAVHDFGWVFLDGVPIGNLDRRHRRFRCVVPPRSKTSRFDILVEAMGRVNFGDGIADRKGLHSPITLSSTTGIISLNDWSAYSLPLDEKMLNSLRYHPALPSHAGPAFWRSYVELHSTHDTFLDLRNWGKGVIWINGFCLGRFWNIGPTQTLYCPGSILHKGKNEIVVLDLLGPRQPQLSGLTAPILNEMHPELDFSHSSRFQGGLNLQGLQPTAIGAFSPQTVWQELKFKKPSIGRYLCLKALDSHDGRPIASGSGIELINADGQIISNDCWLVLGTDSDDPANGGSVDNLLDGQSSSAWSTEDNSAYPHYVVMDLGRSENISGFRFLPKEGAISSSGRIKNYQLFLSDTPFEFLSSGVSLS